MQNISKSLFNQISLVSDTQISCLEQVYFFEPSIWYVILK
jgi:hypothetical protein